MEAVLDRGKEGELIRKARVMGVVEAAGQIAPGDPIAVDLPPPPHKPLLVV